ncbi:MAG TPA: hypothetical protein VIJ94_12725, partial [Caulobacteraceae bacterium]
MSAPPAKAVKIIWDEHEPTEDEPPSVYAGLYQLIGRRKASLGQIRRQLHDSEDTGGGLSDTSLLPLREKVSPKATDEQLCCSGEGGIPFLAVAQHGQDDAEHAACDG